MLNKNILIIGTSSNQLTGYGIVIKYLAEGLIKRGFNVKVLGLQTYGRPYLNYELPMQNQSNLLEFYINNYQITHLITICDIHLDIFANVPIIVKNHNLKWIHHATIQNTPVPKFISDKIKNASKVISPSQFVYDELKKVNIESEIIFHAFTLPIIKVKKDDILEKKKVFICIASNQVQKNLVTILEAFKIIRKKRDDVVLIIITNPLTNDGMNIFKFYQQLNFPSNSVFFIQGRYGYMLTREELAKIYAKADIYVSASMGESFSLPLLEASYYNLPSIVTDFSAMKDFINKYNCGLKVPVKLWQRNYSLSNQALTDSKDFAKSMELMLKKEYFEKFKKNTEKVKNCKEFKLDNVLDKWEKLL